MSSDQPYFYFFSYGSNLLLERIKARVPSVEVIQTYELQGFQLVFNKASKDESTKANIKSTDDSSHFVWGVIQRIDLSEKRALDRAEGLGYGYDLDSLRIPEIDQNIHFYIATESNCLKLGKPYDWYLDYVVYGTIENEFPEDYIQELIKLNCVIDDNPESRPGFDKVLTEKIAAHKKQNPEVWQLSGVS